MSCVFSDAQAVAGCAIRPARCVRRVIHWNHESSGPADAGPSIAMSFPAIPRSTPTGDPAIVVADRTRRGGQARLQFVRGRAGARSATGWRSKSFHGIREWRAAASISSGREDEHGITEWAIGRSSPESGRRSFPRIPVAANCSSPRKRRSRRWTMPALPCRRRGRYVTYTLDSTGEFELIRNLGIHELRYYSRAPYGGAATCAVVLHAAAAVASGAANVVLIYRAFNERSGRRFGLPRTAGKFLQAGACGGDGTCPSVSILRPNGLRCTSNATCMSME